MAQKQDLPANAAERKRRGFGAMSRGWAMGTAGWREALAKTRSQLALNPGLDQKELGGTEGGALEQGFASTLHQIGANFFGVIVEATQTNGWKMEWREGKCEITVPYSWSSQKLHLENVDALRARVDRYHKRHTSHRSPFSLT